MQFSRICIKRPVFTIVLSIMILSLGSIFFTKLQIRGMPNISQPLISVQASYPGADALYMERQITQLIETELKTVKHLESVSSSGSAGQSNINLIFTIDAYI